MKILKISCLFFLMICSSTLFAISRTVSSGASNSEATRLFVKVMEEGGTITFEAGSWDINLTSRNNKIKKNMTVIGNNGRGSNNRIRGAHESWFTNNSSRRTVIKFKAASPLITNGCNVFKVKNIKWEGIRLTTEVRHQPAVDFANVIFEAGIPGAGVGPWRHIIITALDGISGKIVNCSFHNFGKRAIYLNRTLPNSGDPVARIGKLVVDFCKFDAYFRAGEQFGGRALNHDGGNDEFPAIWNHSGKEIKNSLFIETGLGFSKARNVTISNNIFRPKGFTKEIVHLEEYCRDITIHNNQIFLERGADGDIFSLGYLQSSDNITITNNKVNQDGNYLKAFVKGRAIQGFKVKNNSVIGHKSTNKLYSSFSFCDNSGTFSDNSALLQRANNFEIKRGNCTKPINNGTFYITYGSGKYLEDGGNNAVFATKTTRPSGNQFKWRVTNVKVDYFEIKNVKTGHYLEVSRGAKDQEHENAVVNSRKLNIKLQSRRTFGTNRKPVWQISKKNSNYALLAGGNEMHSDMRRVGDEAFVFVIKGNGENRAFNWKFIPASVASTIAPGLKSIDEIEREKVYPRLANSSDQINLVIDNEVGVELFSATGRLVYSARVNSNSVHILPSDLLVSGLYFVRFIGGDGSVDGSHKILIK